MNTNSQGLPSIDEDEIEKAMTNIKKGKSPRSNETITEIIKQGLNCFWKKAKF